MRLTASVAGSLGLFVLRVSVIVHIFFLIVHFAFFLKRRSSRSVFNAPPQAMTWSSMALTDFSCWGAGLKTLKFSKSVNMESKTWLRTVGDLHLGHHQAQLLDRARSAGAAVADEASRLVVPLGEQEIDRVLERAGDAMVVLGRDEDIAVERADLRGPCFGVRLAVLPH